MNSVEIIYKNSQNIDKYITIILSMFMMNLCYFVKGNETIQDELIRFRENRKLHIRIRT